MEVFHLATKQAYFIVVFKINPGTKTTSQSFKILTWSYKINFKKDSNLLKNIVNFFK